MAAMTLSFNRDKPTEHHAWSHPRQRLNWPAIGAILALHAIGLFALMQIDAVRETMTEAAPMFVSFISATPTPQAELPKPQVVKPQAAPRLIAHASPAPAAVKVPSPELQQEPPQTTAAAESIAPAPAAVIPPNFVAAYLDNPAPTYPPTSRNLGERGQVLLRVLVNPEGHAEQIEIDTSSGFDRLDRSAVEGVRRWRFVPAKQGNQAVAAWVLIPINFNLNTNQ